MWTKALEDHGFDLNKLTAKYWKKGAGYDEMLGKVDERGKGGVFKQGLDQAETAIQKVMKSSSQNTKVLMNDFVKDLQAEKRLLAKIPGNESNITALDEFIKGFQAKYAKGITPKQLLEVKRATDSRFGAAVANETTGTPTAQAQKMLANASRNVLKKLFPTVKDALDTQSEILTMRPIINRARAITSTRGSEIRVGKVSNVDLLNPLSWIKASEVILDDPKRASRLLKSTEEVIEGKIRAPMMTKGSIVGRTAGILAGTSLSEIEDQPHDSMNNQVADNANNDITNNKPESEMNQFNTSTNPSIAQFQQSQQDPSTLPFGGRSKNELLQLALSEGATLKDLKEIAEIYDLIAGEEETTKLELTDSAIKNVTDIKGAIADVQALTQNISQKELTGPIRGLMAKVPYATESRSMQAEIDRVRQVVGKALEGGVLRKEDEEKYKKILPTMEDTKEVALSKLEQLYAKLNEDLNTYVNLQGQYGKGRGFENIINPTQ